jgi:ATP/ADP translocase
LSEARRSIDGAIRMAAICAAVMIANQVGGKATRDALFLSTYDVTKLPYVVVAGAVLSLGTVLVATRLMRRHGPGRVLPPAFGLSGVLLLVEWSLVGPMRPVAAVLVYLHMSMFGGVVISGFWSLVSERFDPRTARRRIGTIAAGATLGGLLGGLLAERVAAGFQIATMLPLLAGMHIVCAALVFGIRDQRTAARSHGADGAPAADGSQKLRSLPYVRQLAMLVLFGAVVSGLIDYVFKAEASARYRDGEELMRFFAVFYTGLALAVFVFQSTLSRTVIERLGPARAVAVPPMALAVAGVGVLLVPGLAAVAAMTALEGALRSSLHRSGYELLYTPVSPADKRATKTIVDVGVDRMGDVLAGGLIVAILLAPESLVFPVLIGLAVALAVVALTLIPRLQRGYIQALERGMVSRADELDLGGSDDLLGNGTIARTMAVIDLPRALRAAGATDAVLRTIALSRAAQAESQDRPETAAGPAGPRDPLVERFAALRSGDPVRVRECLRAEPALATELVPLAIRLLAWDEVYEEVVTALRNTAPRITGQLLDALLDHEEEFAIRRRVPRVLGHSSSQRVVDGLIEGLRDPRFEVRFRCGLALVSSRLQASSLRFEDAAIHEAVLREVNVDRRVWEAHKLLDRDAGTSEVDDFLRERTNRGLEHVFNLLSLVLPPEALRIAFRGLGTDDAVLRGTALEYLESVLPPRIRERLWPFLEPEAVAPSKSDKPREEILASLMRSGQSIEISLQELKARAKGS